MNSDLASMAHERRVRLVSGARRGGVDRRVPEAAEQQAFRVTTSFWSRAVPASVLLIAFARASTPHARGFSTKELP